MFRTPSSLFRVLAIAEAVSWTLLIAGLILRATTDVAIGVTIGGGIHGLVFLSYGATAVLLTLNNRWSAGPAIAAIASAIIPYATIPTEIWLSRTGRLAGEWRTVLAEDPAERRWYDGPLAWFLRRPLVLVASLMLAVIALFVVLLLIGPPGGR